MLRRFQKLRSHYVARWQFWINRPKWPHKKCQDDFLTIWQKNLIVKNYEKNSPRRFFVT